MAFEEVFRDVFGDYRFELFQQVEVAAAEFGGDFKTYVQELAQVIVERRIFRIMPEGRNKLIGRPFFYNRRCG